MAEADDRRPSPEALLALASREHRGKLKIFLGAAPGVGKTYAMLQNARQARAEGRDVVIGVVETHGRSDTAALLDGLEILPRRDIAYRGHALTEFDIDAALTRKPSLIVVDELAHSNAPESRHPKRYQDVQELLAAGINVWTALNIQHIESLADLVAAITGVKVRELVPDTVIEDADDVVLVDITPDELIRRLRDGKVYLPDNARRAADHYFQLGNITALRDLALRRTAQRVDDQMTDFLRQKAIEGPWPSAERILVCVGDDPGTEMIVRSAARLAAGLNAPWFALHLEQLGSVTAPERQRRADAALTLAGRLGAGVLRLAGSSPVSEILRIAKRENVTQIVVGRSRRRRFDIRWHRSLADELVKAAKGVAVHIPATEEPEAAALQMVWPKLSVNGIGAAAFAVALATLTGTLLSREMKLPNLSMIYLAAVLFCAMRFGAWSAVAASILSFLAYNFFFIAPVYTLTVASPHELLALVIFLLVAIFTGSLAGRAREQSLAAQARLKQVQSLLDVSRKLSTTMKVDDVLWVLATQAAAISGGETVVLLKRDGELAIAAAMPPEDDLSTADWAAARWASSRGDLAGWQSDTMPNARFQFRALRTPHGIVGAIGVRAKGEKLASETERMLNGVIEQAALAIERSLLADEAAEARSSAESEKLRAALLSSLSHDLRTPLSSILGAVTTLRGLHGSLPPEARDDLLAAIEEEASRLSRFVANLLDMTRLEGGALKIRPEPVDVGDVAAAVVRRARRTWPNRDIVLKVAPVPPIAGEAALLELMLFNLLENAHKYAPEGTPIRLTVAPAGLGVELQVVDEGMGIPPADLERIFEKFYRVTAGDGRPPGTGLGLAICRAIATVLGGRIHAESPVEGGRGTRIVAEFPVIAP